MPIGTGDSQLFQDEFHMHSNDFLKPPSLPSEGVDDKDTLPQNFAPTLDRQMIIKPHDPTESDANLMEPVTKTSDFMTEVNKQQMPFPDNRNPDMDFNNRFGNLPPSGILNDLKPPPEKPLQRKL